MSAKPLIASAFLMVAIYAAAIAQNNAQVERGKDLVESVGVCQDCHTPRTEAGELDKSRWLKGADIRYSPLTAIPKWHKTAPDLSASSRLFKTWGPDGLVNFLVTGKNPKGGTAGPPMPLYKMSREDALAVIEYLKTVE
jgi:mono/diheme cytochrome c family protein